MLPLRGAMFLQGSDARLCAVMEHNTGVEYMYALCRVRNCPSPVSPVCTGSIPTRTCPHLPHQYCPHVTHRVYTHHYEQYMDLSMFTHATETVSSIIESYNAIDTAPPPPVTRFRSRGLSFI